MRGSIRHVLEEEAIGKDNAISSSELAKRLGVNDSTAWPKTRALIRDLVINEGVPIGSCNKGYYIITSEKEFNDVIRTLNSRIERTRERRDSLEKAFQGRV